MNWLGLNDAVPLDEDEISGRRDAEKFRVYLVAATRVMAIFVYAAMIFMINCCFDGSWKTVIMYMLAILIVQELCYIIALVYGAHKLSVVYYTLLFMLTRWYSVGEMSTVIQVITLIAIPCQVTHGILLFYGAIEEVVWALETAIWFCLAVAAYNTILGVMGGIYFIRTGTEAMHFVIAALFCLMAFSLFTVLCHDIVIIYTLKKTIAFAPPYSETFSNTELSPVAKL